MKDKNGRGRIVVEAAKLLTDIQILGFMCCDSSIVSGR